MSATLNDKVTTRTTTTNVNNTTLNDTNNRSQFVIFVAQFCCSTYIIQTLSAIVHA